MKLLILCLTCVFSSSLFADELKSDKLRTNVCYALSEVLSDDNLDLDYKKRWGNETIEVIPDFYTRCEKSKKSFTVTESVFNEQLGKVVIMEVAVDFELKNEVLFSGSIKLSRKVSLDNKGQIELGRWVSSDFDIDYTLGELAIDAIAEVIIDGSQSEGGGIGEYDNKKFSVAKELKALDAEVEQDQDEGYCKKEPFSEDNRLSVLFDVEDIGANTSDTTPTLVELLKKKGHLEAVLYNEVTEWEESCAYYDFYIYLKNGTVIALSYDFTT